MRIATCWSGSFAKSTFPRTHATTSSTCICFDLVRLFGFDLIGFWVLGFEFWVLGLGVWVWGWEFGVWGLEFGFWGLEVGVRGVGYRG